MYFIEFPLWLSVLVLEEFTIWTIFDSQVDLFIIVEGSIQFDDVRVIQGRLYLDLSYQLILHLELHDGFFAYHFQSKMEPRKSISSIRLIWYFARNTSLNLPLPMN